MPLPALMASSRDSWYYLVSANFYTNHVGEDFGGRATKRAAQQSGAAAKGVKGRQGAAGAATNRSSMIFSTTKDGLKLLMNAEWKDKGATWKRAARDAEGRLTGHFTTKSSYQIVTSELDGTEKTVDAQFEYGVAVYPDGRYRIVHFVGVHV